MVQEELNGTRKDKFMLQAKVVELRNTMKTVLQQNNQLKQDLKNNKMRKVTLIYCVCSHKTSEKDSLQLSFLKNVIFVLVTNLGNGQ